MHGAEADQTELDTMTIKPSLRLNHSSTTDRGSMQLPETYVSPTLLEALGRQPPDRHLDPTELVDAIESTTIPLPRRLVAGALLAVVGDPRTDVDDPAMVMVPGCTFAMGLGADAVDDVWASWRHVGVARDWILKEAPAHEVAVDTFLLGRHPVTNFEYRVFLQDTDRLPPSSWRLGGYPWFQSNHPVHGVAIEDARAYARWLSVRTGRRFRLPTEAEWELAATGGDTRAFPWGDDFDPARANTLEGGPLTTTPIGAYPDGSAPCGARDLAGNVEEWVDERYRPYPGGQVVEDDLWHLDPNYQITRGGSYARFGDLARCRRRHGPFPRDLYVVGFRVAEDVTT